jgi:hypothetical protein
MAYPTSSYYGSPPGSISSLASSYEYFTSSPTFSQKSSSPVSSEDSWRKSYSSRYALEYQLSPPPPPALLRPLRPIYTSPKRNVWDPSSPNPTAGPHYYSSPQQTSQEVSFPPIYFDSPPPKRYGSPATDAPYDTTPPLYPQDFTSARNYPPPPDSFEIAVPPGAHIAVHHSIPSPPAPRLAIISPPPSIHDQYSSLTELNALWNAAQGAVSDGWGWNTFRDGRVQA